MVQQALSSASVQFYFYPCYKADLAETVSDYCLGLFRLGLGGVVEVARPVNALDTAPSMRTHTLYGYETMVGEIGGWLMCLVAFTIGLPFTLLGLLLVYYSESHQNNWDAWQAADHNKNVRAQIINASLNHPNDPQLLVGVIDQECQEMFDWMVDRAMIGSAANRATLIQALIQSNRGADRFIAAPEDLFEKLVAFCIAHDDAGPVLEKVGRLSSDGKSRFRNLLLTNQETLSEPKRALLHTWQGEVYLPQMSKLAETLEPQACMRRVIDEESHVFFKWMVREVYSLGEEVKAALATALIASKCGDLRLVMYTPDDIFTDLVKRCLPDERSTDFFLKVMMYPSQPRKELLRTLFREQPNLSEPNRRLLANWESKGLGRSLCEEAAQKQGAV